MSLLAIYILKLWQVKQYFNIKIIWAVIIIINRLCYFALNILRNTILIIKYNDKRGFYARLKKMIGYKKQ